MRANFASFFQNVNIFGGELRATRGVMFFDEIGEM